MYNGVSKKIKIITIIKIFSLFLLMCSSPVFSQVVTFLESDLTAYVRQFKNDAFHDNEREYIGNRLKYLLNDIQNCIDDKTYKTGEFTKIKTIQNQVEAFKAFVDQTNGNSSALTEPQFFLVTQMLDISPIKLPFKQCELATFYEVQIDQFKATFLCNELTSTNPMESLIKVEFGVIMEGKIIEGSYLQLCCNNVSCIYVLSDWNKFYHRVGSAKCTYLGH